MKSHINWFQLLYVGNDILVNISQNASTKVVVRMSGVLAIIVNVVNFPLVEEKIYASAGAYMFVLIVFKITISVLK